MSEWFGHEPYIVGSEEFVNKPDQTLMNDDCGYNGGKSVDDLVSNEVPVEVNVLCNDVCRKQMDYYEDTIVKLNDMNKHLRDKVALYSCLTYFFALTTCLPLLYMLVEYLTLKGLM